MDEHQPAIERDIRSVMKDQPPARERVESADPLGQAGCGPFRILVIEDNVDLADTLCALLEILGHEAVAAHDGISGIERFRGIHPQIVFCDIGLPGQNGYEVAQALRSEPDSEQVYMIALSGYAQDDDISRAMAAGFNRHLAKPVNIEILQQTLDSEDIRAIIC